MELNAQYEWVMRMLGKRGDNKTSFNAEKKYNMDAQSPKEEGCSSRPSIRINPRATSKKDYPPYNPRIDPEDRRRFEERSLINQVSINIQSVY